MLWTPAWAELPGLRTWIERLARDLRSGRSILVLLPDDSQPEGVWGFVYSHLEVSFADLNVRELYLPELDAASPAAAVAEAFDIQAGRPYTPASVVAGNGQPDVIALNGFDDLLPDHQKTWLDFVSRWAKSAHTHAGLGGDMVHHLPAALCLITRARSVLGDAVSQNKNTPTPVGDTRLSIRWQWRTPDPLDVRLFCRTRVCSSSFESPAASSWREHILPKIAMGDPYMVEALWDTVMQPSSVLFTALQEEAKRRGWTKQLLVQLGAEVLLESSSGYLSFEGRSIASHPIDEPPRAIRGLWQIGAIHEITPGRSELHSAALVVFGQDGYIRHRLWHGQLELLLPLINEVRLTVCDRITRKHGPGWPTKWFSPPDSQIHFLSLNSTECELSHLLDLLRECAQLRNESLWSTLLRRALDIRNKIAHYEPVNFDQYDVFLQDYHRTLSCI